MVLLHMGTHLEGEELVSLLLEASDDLAHKVALHAVGLDHDVSALHDCCSAIACGEKGEQKKEGGCIKIELEGGNLVLVEDRLFVG